MARVSQTVSDKSGNPVDGDHYTLRLTPTSSSRGVYVADLTLEEADEIQKETNARKVKRSGRPKAGATEGA